MRNALPPLEQRVVEVKGGTLRYFIGGSGPPLVLLHGLAGAAANWVDVVPLLAQRFRLLVPDLPGHGGSAPLAAAASLDPYADRVVRLLDREGIEAAALAGHSLGGVVALRFAVSFPERVRALVLVASAGIRSTTREAERFLTGAAILKPARLFSRFRAAIARHAALRYLAFGYIAASDPPALSASAVEGFLGAPGLHSDTESAMRALVRDDPRVDLGRVCCPAFVVWGARDHQVTIDDAFEYARRLRAPVRLVPDCGHLLIGERPDAVAAAISDWVR